MSRVDRALKPFYCPLQQRNNRGLFAVEINSRIGLFAQLNMCLNIFSHCDRTGLRPYVALTSPLYAGASGANWFDTYFDNLALTDANRADIASGRIRISCIAEIEDLGLPGESLAGMTLERGNALLSRYMRPKTYIREYVDAFAGDQLGARPVLGVHFRGTDKKSEASAVSQAECLRVVQRYLARHPETRSVFVASDEQDFVDLAARELRGVRVVAHADLERSRDGKPIHSRSGVGDRAAKAREALVNCLILSRCDVLIRTASFLSAWASIFNPLLPVVMLNRPYAHTLWFPDSEIVKRALPGYAAEEAGYAPPR